MSWDEPVRDQGIVPVAVAAMQMTETRIIFADHVAMAAWARHAAEHVNRELARSTHGLPLIRRYEASPREAIKDATQHTITVKGAIMVRAYGPPRPCAHDIVWLTRPGRCARCLVEV